MRLIMAVSRDGYVARRPADRMDWLGPFDKAAFRVLTGVGGVCGVGRRTAVVMPPMLEGRVLYALSRHDPVNSLESFAALHPDGWLLGGQQIALAAIGQGLIREAHICRSDRMAFPDPGNDETYCDRITDRLRSTGYKVKLKTKVGDTSVEAWHG